MQPNRKWTMGLAILGFAAVATAQVDTGKPRDATALCKDGTFYTGDDQAAACKANGGVQEWWGKVLAPKDVPDRARTPGETRTPTPAKEPARN